MTERRADHVLVVDDNRQNRFLAEGQLMSAGYAVTLAEGGLQALELFAANPPDLVLLDVMMPELDGFETCRRLRALPGGAETPIVFLTALTELSALDRASEVGVDDYLTKPINRIELLIRVRSLLRIKRMQRELQRSYDALARSEKQRAELSEFVVHDLKNPLAVILANAQFALQTLEPSAPARDALTDVVSAVDGMNSMVMNLLDISRSEAGAMALQRTPCDLGALISEATAAVHARAAERKMSLSIAAPALVVSGDRHVLRRVLDNLLDNTLKYAPRGSEVCVALAAPSGQDVLLSISDRGMGVPDALKQRVFDKFVQLDEHAASHGRISRGLGLAFCKVAVEAHGGSIWIEDAVPQGTVFNLRLPISDVGTRG